MYPLNSRFLEHPLSSFFYFSSFLYNNCKVVPLILITVTYAYRLAKLDAVFQSTDEVRIRKLHHLEGIVLLHVPDPLVGLTLRINE